MPRRCFFSYCLLFNSPSRSLAVVEEIAGDIIAPNRLFWFNSTRHESSTTYSYCSISVRDLLIDLFSLAKIPSKEKDFVYLKATWRIITISICCEFGTIPVQVKKCLHVSSTFSAVSLALFSNQTYILLHSNLNETLVSNLPFNCTCKS